MVPSSQFLAPFSRASVALDPRETGDANATDRLGEVCSATWPTPWSEPTHQPARRGVCWLAAHEASVGRPDVEIRAPSPIERPAVVAVHDDNYVDALLAAEGRPFAVDQETTGSAESGSPDLSTRPP